MTDVSDERLAELIYLREQMIKISGGDSFDGLDTLDAFRELQRRRASDRWIPWKPLTFSDTLPPDNLYWVAMRVNNEHPIYYGAFRADDHWGHRCVIAYWSRPLPAPFDFSMGDQHG
jgi:hypothetical protein